MLAVGQDGERVIRPRYRRRSKAGDRLLRGTCSSNSAAFFSNCSIT